MSVQWQRERPERNFTERFTHNTSTIFQKYKMEVTEVVFELLATKAKVKFVFWRFSPCQGNVLPNLVLIAVCCFSPLQYKVFVETVVSRLQVLSLEN